MIQRWRVIGGTVLAATLLSSTGLVAATVTLAQAATPPFDPASNGATQGTLSLYNASGAKVTTGDLDNRPVWAQANTDQGRQGDNLATLIAATPQQGVLPALWPSEQISAATTYPNSTAPGALKNSPKATVGTIINWFDPGNPDSYASAFPNVNTTASWQDLYQLRIVTSGPGQAPDAQRYSSATIEVDEAAGTWTQVYPDPDAQAPTVVTPAAIAGTPKTGATLTCNATFDGADSVGYKWFRGTKAINGATAKTYKAVSMDFDKNVKCRAIGANANGSTATTSPAVKIGLGDALVASTKPKVVGTPKVGQTLSCRPGTWTPAASSYTYSWLKNGNKIRRATSKSYTVPGSASGAKISCKVTALQTGYANGVAKSRAVTIA